ncbi:MAG: aspartate kinase [Acidobacteriota bacterium]
MTSGPTIHKFGGASLADGRALAHALSLVEAAPGPSVVVVSAFSGVTDALLALAQSLPREGEAPARDGVRRLRDRYRAAARTVVRRAPARKRLLEEVDRAFAEVEALARAPRFLREISPSGVDHILVRGEQLAARIFAAGLLERGIPAEYVDAVGMIATDGRAGQAFPDLTATDRKVRRRLQPLLDAGRVPVVPGFAGTAADGRAVTLGRGGSDLTATLLGRALAARAVLLWKDVPGFLTADPRVVPDARVIPQLNVREAAELAYYGARVLQPRALIPLAGRRVPVFVRPFSDPGRSGTEISRRRTLAGYPVKALSAMQGQALVTVTGNGMLGVPGIAARTFGALHQEAISVSLISQASSEHSICLSVPSEHAELARESLRSAFSGELERGELDGVEVSPDLATISVVGLGMAGTPGIASRVFAPLARAGINVVAIAQGSSELNISFVVSAAQAAEAQRRIHDAFQLAKIGGGAGEENARADVALLGFGHVGRTLARLLVARGERVRLVAVIDRGGLLFRAEGLSSRTLRRVLAAKSRTGSVAAAASSASASRRPRRSARDAIAELADHALSRPILVDVTAEDTAALLEGAAHAGFDLVLANKRPLAGSRRDARAVREAVEANGRRLRFEATVGAGLPILDTYRKLIDSGDRVLKIEGCLSGTLGFLLTEVEAGRKFSESLRIAIRRGYAEPDPREDLSGADVGRKALILGRLLGFAGEPESVSVENLVPERARRIALERFLSRLEAWDPAWERRVAGTRSRKRVLRYVASVTRRRIRVGLVEVAAGEPFGSLAGTDNQVAFTTARYRSNPLIIQGPGAGLEVTAGGIFNDIATLAGA